jgi:hypothetical protein
MHVKRKKITVITVLIAFVLIASSMGAYGAVKSITKNVQATFRNINIYVYGKKLSRDIEPFILTDKGVTMVPLRLISEALGEEVGWDERTSSIYIGSIPHIDSARSQYEPTLIEDITVLRNVGPFYEFKSRNLTIARRQFRNGIAVEIDNNSVREVVLELKGHYSRLEGYIGVDDETRNSSTGFIFSVYGDGIEKSVESVMKPSDYPRLVEIDVRGVKRLTIRVEGLDHRVGEYSRTIAALADFKLLK